MVTVSPPASRIAFPVLTNLQLHPQLPPETAASTLLARYKKANPNMKWYNSIQVEAQETAYERALRPFLRALLASSTAIGVRPRHVA